MPKPVRLQDIARELNVSTSLVSAVLNNRSGMWVSERTRERIVETAQRMGYRPQAAARMLRSGRTHSVALLYGYHEYVRVEGLAQTLAEAGYRLHVYALRDDDEFQSTLHDIVNSRSVDGIVLWGSERKVEQYGEYLQRQGVKFVVKGRHEQCHPEWYQIDFDHEGMMREAVVHLASLGHRRIAYLGYPMEETYRFHLLKGFTESVQQITGEPPADELIACNVNSVADAEHQVEEWLRLPVDRQPTAAIITADNHGWYGMEKALAKHGRFIGEQAGDFGVSGQCQPDLMLAFGSAHAHVNIDLNVLGATLAQSLLLPLLEDREPGSRIIRILPAMTPVDTLQMRPLLERYLTDLRLHEGGFSP